MDWRGDEVLGVEVEVVVAVVGVGRVGAGDAAAALVGAVDGGEEDGAEDDHEGHDGGRHQVEHGLSVDELPLAGVRVGGVDAAGQAEVGVGGPVDDLEGDLHLRGGGDLDDVGRGQVGDGRAVAGLVLRHQGVEEELVGPGEADGGALAGAGLRGGREEAAVDGDAVGGEGGGVGEGGAVRVAAELVVGRARAGVLIEIIK